MLQIPENFTLKLALDNHMSLYPSYLSRWKKIMDTAYYVVRGFLQNIQFDDLVVTDADDKPSSKMMNLSFYLMVAVSCKDNCR